MPPPPPPPRLHELCAGSMNTLARGACERVQSVQYIYTRGAVAVSAALYREREVNRRNCIGTVRLSERRELERCESWRTKFAGEMVERRKTKNYYWR